MGGLDNRIRRLEDKASRADVPGWQEYEAARNRERARVLLSAFAKMPGEHKPERHRSEQDRRFLARDTEEQRKQDAEVIARYEEAHGVHYDLDVLAEKAR